MATVEGLFRDAAQAERAVEQLRGMDIPTSEISMLTRADNQGGILVMAQVPEGQKVAAQQILSMAGATSSAGDATSYTQDAVRGGDVDQTGRTTTVETEDAVGMGPKGFVDGTIAGTAVAGGLTNTGAAPLAANLLSHTIGDDNTVNSDADYNVADTPGTYMGGGATSRGADLPDGDRSDR